MNHFVTPEFWFPYRRLPPETRELADRCFAMLRGRPAPSVLEVAYGRLEHPLDVRVGDLDGLEGRSVCSHHCRAASRVSRMTSRPVDFGKGTGHNHDNGSRAMRWALRSSLARARACRACLKPKPDHVAATWPPRVGGCGLQPMVEWSVDRWTKPLRDGLRSCSWTTIPSACKLPGRVSRRPLGADGGELHRPPRRALG